MGKTETKKAKAPAKAKADGSDVESQEEVPLVIDQNTDVTTEEETWATKAQSALLKVQGSTDKEWVKMIDSVVEAFKATAQLARQTWAKNLTTGKVKEKELNWNSGPMQGSLIYVLIKQQERFLKRN